MMKKREVILLAIIMSALFVCGCEQVEQAVKDESAYNLSDVSLYDFDNKGETDELADIIFSEGSTVVIYGRTIDMSELLNGVLKDDRVVGTSVASSNNEESMCYACVTTCIEGRIYVGSYRLSWAPDVTDEDMEPFIKNALKTDNIYKIGSEFREKKEEYYVLEICGIPEEK